MIQKRTCKADGPILLGSLWNQGISVTRPTVSAEKEKHRTEMALVTRLKNAQKGGVAGEENEELVNGSV